MINKYHKFLLEKQIYNLVLEGKMIFSNDFIGILDILSTNQDNSIADLASLIRDYVSKNVNIDTNCIDVSDKTGMISFVPDDKIKEEELTYRISTRATTLFCDQKNPHSLFKELDIPLYGVINLDPRFLTNDVWRLIKKANAEFYNFDFYYLQDIKDLNRRIVVYANNGVDVIIPNMSTSSRKSDVRLGRFINKFLSAIDKEYTAATIEKFVNQYESEILLIKESFKNFKIVEGEEIRKWYNQIYHESGTGQLGNSCMRYSKCSDFFDIYVQNPKVCKLLIFINEKNELRGRALLWTLSDGTKYMDRIYTNKDSYDSLFLKWGEQNNYKSNLSSNTINVRPGDYELYPFMDTFRFYDASEGKLSSDRIFQRPYAQLDETEGEADWKI